MEAIKIKLHEKEYSAKLSADAIETVEAQFNDIGLVKLLVEKASYRLFKAVIVAAIVAVDPKIKTQELIDGIKWEVEEGPEGLTALSDQVVALINASGIRGAEAARKALGKD